MSMPASGIIRGEVAPGRPATPSAAAPKRPPWGWLELISLSPTIFPALLFIPGISAIRTPLRILDFTLVLMVWMAVLVLGRRRQVGRVLRADGHPGGLRGVASAVDLAPDDQFAALGNGRGGAGDLDHVPCVLGAPADDHPRADDADAAADLFRESAQLAVGIGAGLHARSVQSAGHRGIPAVREA